MTAVRPTKRCLDDLDLSFPPLEQPLHEMEHALIAKAQRVPSEVAAGGAERVLAIDDRVWFKVKVGSHRGAAGLVADGPEGLPDVWWLVAAGVRRADSQDVDFYAVLEAACRRSAEGSRSSVSSEHLLLQDIDLRRWRLEETTLAVVSIQGAVRDAIRRSALAGEPVEARTRAPRATAWVVSREGETYLAIAAAGFLDPREVAVVLASVPGVTADDWQIEPGEVLGIAPSMDRLVYSTLLSTDLLAAMLDVDREG